MHFFFQSHRTSSQQACSPRTRKAWTVSRSDVGQKLIYNHFTCEKGSAQNGKHALIKLITADISPRTYSLHYSPTRTTMIGLVKSASSSPRGYSTSRVPYFPQYFLREKLTKLYCMRSGWSDRRKRALQRLTDGVAEKKGDRL